MGKQRSLGVIAVLNSINTILGMLFPLITYPYISRVLGVENMGKINFSNACVSYFALISALGIYTYAVREGAIVREKKTLFNEFANEIFTINFFSMFIAYIVQFISISLSTKLQNYLLLICIQSLSMFFTTIGVQWIYAVYEEYTYIVIRNVVFQMISLVSMFLFVKNEGDYYIYAIIIVISSGGSNLLNFIHSRKYFKIRIVCVQRCVKHLKSILTMFATTIASTIYVNSDNIILGFMWGDSSVGLYSIAVKIYSILKTLVNAVFGATLPRITIFFAVEKTEEAFSVINRITQLCCFLVAPIVIGVNILCNEVVYIVGGNQYLDSVFSLRILMIAFIFSIFASLYSTLVLLPKKYERIITQASILSGVLNILLNFIFIKYWKQDGAAITTAISEMVVCFIFYFYSKKIIRIEINWCEIIKIILAAMSMIPVSIFVKSQLSSFWIRTFGVLILCSAVYFSVLVMLRSNIFQLIAEWIKKK